MCHLNIFYESFCIISAVLCKQQYVIWCIFNSLACLFIFFSGLFDSMVPVKVTDWKVIYEMTDNLFMGALNPMLTITSVIRACDLYVFN